MYTIKFLEISYSLVNPCMYTIFTHLGNKTMRNYSFFHIHIYIYTYMCVCLCVFKNYYCIVFKNHYYAIDNI